jgi:hypothetical protein
MEECSSRLLLVQLLPYIQSKRTSDFLIDFKG